MERFLGLFLGIMIGLTVGVLGAVLAVKFMMISNDAAFTGMFFSGVAFGIVGAIKPKWLSWIINQFRFL